MRIAVCVKHAVDETELRVNSSGRPLIEGAAAKMSTFDKNAVEEALRLRTALAGEVVAYTVGSGEARKTLKEALAMGADRGVIVSADISTMDTLRTAELLSAALTMGGPFDVIICSEGSSDTYTGQVPPMLAEVLGLPYVGYARVIEVTGKVAKVERSLEDSVEVLEVPVPFLVSVVSEINEPRYPTLIQIMQASKKPVDEINEDVLLRPSAPLSVHVISMAAQKSVRKHILIEGGAEDAAAKLIDALEEEGVLSK